MQSVRRTISLFTGVGGLDLGLEAAGFDVAVAIEVDRDAVEVIRKNRSSWPVPDIDGRPQPIEALDSSSLLKIAQLRVGEAAILVGGPPCQPFSKSGYWASGDALRLRDPRANTLREYFRVLSETLPEVFLLENVPGLTFEGKDEGLLFIERRLRAINREKGTNYTHTVAQLNAAHFGVPQLRERVFVVGHREGRAFHFPEPRYGTDAGPYLTAWDAIGDREDDDDPSLRMTGRWAELLHRFRRARTISGTLRAEGAPAVRLEKAVLELPVEALEGSSVLDATSRAGPGNRTLPLEEPPPVHARDVPAPDHAGRLHSSRESSNYAAAAGQCRALGTCRGSRARNQTPAVTGALCPRGAYARSPSVSRLPAFRSGHACSSQIPAHRRETRGTSGHRSRPSSTPARRPKTGIAA